MKKHYMRSGPLKIRVPEYRFPPWQPIETAPMDGSEVLIYGGLGVIKVCWYSGRVWAWEHDNDITYGATIYCPTHWMPLPPPPPKNT